MGSLQKNIMCDRKSRVFIDRHYVISGRNNIKWSPPCIMWRAGDQFRACSGYGWGRLSLGSYDGR